MSFDPRQPVLIGIGTCMQHEDDFALAKEPMDLMLEAVRAAGHDAGGDAGHAEILRGVQHIAVPRGRWRYRDPAGEIAQAIGAVSATTVLAGVGVLQQSLIGAACSRIAAGEIDSALIAGADTGYRILRARLAGARAHERQQDSTPHISLEPAEELLHPAELQAGIRMPAALYAIIESAFRAARGWSLSEHRQRLGDMYRKFSETASANPEAWQRKALPVADISEASQRNPMQAFPYTRAHCANWNVDQAAALLLCSAGRAQALGIAPSAWVYACASTESNHMVPVSARLELARCEGAAVAGKAALSAAGLEVSQLDLVELYSCFPVAVETCADALGIDLRRALSVTGGMSFAGGPFNNYVLQATCRMAQLIREGRGRNGLVYSVSGILTKQGFGVWASRPPPDGFASINVSAEVATRVRTKEVAVSFNGKALVVGCTVLHDKAKAPRALVLADTESACRALAWSEDAALVERIQSSEFCGAAIAIRDGLFSAA